MKIILSFVFTLFIYSFIYSQENNVDVTNVTKIGVLNPGFSYEKRIGKHQTAFFQAFMNTRAPVIFSDALGGWESAHMDPAFTLEYRFYYNVNRMQKKGSKGFMNSFNYISPVFETSFSKEWVSEFYAKRQREPIYKFAAVWGIQRNLLKRFSIDFNVGPAVLFTKEVNENYDTHEPEYENIVEYCTLGQLNIGFWLNKRH
ncbi:MAG TPA: hypothetical protein VGC75_06790 [Candidatus Nitrosocosmicus sp.]